jgi:hypothetical protein
MLHATSQVTVRLSCNGSELRIEVSDGVDLIPVPRQADDDNGNGRASRSSPRSSARITAVRVQPACPRLSASHLHLTPLTLGDAARERPGRCGATSSRRCYPSGDCRQLSHPRQRAFPFSWLEMHGAVIQRRCGHDAIHHDDGLGSASSSNLLLLRGQQRPGQRIFRTRRVCSGASSRDRCRRPGRSAPLPWWRCQRLSGLGERPWWRR